MCRIIINKNSLRRHASQRLECKLTIASIAKTASKSDPMAAGTRYPHLEMTPAMSTARILNTTIPIDFEHVRAEETRRQRMLAALREWSLTILHRPIRTQADMIRFRAAYTNTYREAA